MASYGNVMPAVGHAGATPNRSAFVLVSQLFFFCLVVRRDLDFPAPVLPNDASDDCSLLAGVLSRDRTKASVFIQVACSRRICFHSTGDELSFLL